MKSETVWKEQGSLGLCGWVYMYVWCVYMCVCACVCVCEHVSMCVCVCVRGCVTIKIILTELHVHARIYITDK